MKLDKNTFLTIIFTLVDDIMKDPKISDHLRRPGINPNLSDSEIVTLGLYQELIGENREDHFFRLHQKISKITFLNLMSEVDTTEEKKICIKYFCQ